MPIQLADYPIPGSASAKYPTAYAWLPGIYLDRSPANGGARLVLTVHPTEGDWQEPPIGQLEVKLGDVARPGLGGEAEARFATLDELLAETATIGDTGITFAQAFAAMGERLYVESLKHPACDGASLVP